MDYEYLRGSDGGGRAVLAHITANRLAGATVIQVDDLDNWPNEFIVTTSTIGANGYLEVGSITEMRAHKDSGDIIIDSFEPGYTDQGNSTDEVAILKQTTGWANGVVDNLEVVDDELSDIKTGWIDAGEAWSYSSWDGTNKTGVITVPTDATTKYSAGMRIRISQSTGGTKYGIITKVASTALTVYFGTDYTFTNETVSNPYYSVQKAPFGFPLDPAKWTVKSVTTSTASTSSPPSAPTYVNLGSLSLSIPIGVWDVDYSVSVQSVDADNASSNLYTTLSTSTTAESDSEMTTFQEGSMVGPNANQSMYRASKRKPSLALTSATTYYLLESQSSGGDQMVLQGNKEPQIIRAVCAYL